MSLTALTGGFILGVFVIARWVKLLKSESTAGDIARAFVRSIIDRIDRRKDTPIDRSENE